MRERGGNKEGTRDLLSEIGRRGGGLKSKDLKVNNTITLTTHLMQDLNTL